MPEAEAHRQITRRDAQPEGEPDTEPSARTLDNDEQAMKDAQRDLTSLSGPPLREKHAQEDERDD